MTQIARPTRKIVIDGSLLGMGRVPGNLCIEQMMDYMNEQFGASYALEPVYDAIDDYIAPIKLREPWGYAIPYALSAKYHLHRTYAEYLMSKKRLKTKDIQRILAQVEPSEAETFNEAYIEQLYLDYMDVKYDDRIDFQKLQDEISKFENVLVLAPGESIKNHYNDIVDSVNESTCVISVNFNPDIQGIKTNYIFLTNTKRYDAIKDRKTKNKLIITSNLMRDVDEQDYIIAYNELVYFNDDYCDDSTLMLIKLLSKFGVRNIIFAGFDGRKNGVLSFYDDSFDRNLMKTSNGMIVKNILDTVFSDISKTFITESEYQ
jgi:4-hydroxy 2-oxovalerate aldolase